MLKYKCRNEKYAVYYSQPWIEGRRLMNIFFFKLIFEVDGGWSNWNAWSPCSSPTGDGWRIRARTCSNPSPLNGGHDCVGLSFNSVACSLTPTFGLFPYSYLSLISSNIMTFMYYGIKVKHVYHIHLMWLENFILYGGNGVVFCGCNI